MCGISKMTWFKNNKIFYSFLIACILCTGYFFLRYSKPGDLSEDLQRRLDEAGNAVSISREVLMALEAEISSRDPLESAELRIFFQELREKNEKVEFLRGISASDPQLAGSPDFIKKLENAFMDLSSSLEQVLPGWGNRIGQEAE